MLLLYAVKCLGDLLYAVAAIQYLKKSTKKEMYLELIMIHV